MAASETFGSWLRERRSSLRMTQQQLAKKMFVSTALVSYWENDRRIPDVAMLGHFADCLGVTDAELLPEIRGQNIVPTVMLVDDEKIILKGALRTLSAAMPEAKIYGFSTVDEAIRFAADNRIDIAFLDIELRRGSGLALAEELRRMHPKVNVIFLTSYREYAMDAWELGVSGYILKPLTLERVKQELSVLRFPVHGLEE